MPDLDYYNYLNATGKFIILVFCLLYNLNLKYFFCAEYTVPGTDDAKDWMEVLEAMEIMELSQV